MGSEWLGLDLERGAAIVPPLPDEISKDCWSKVTENPRRYGFHATLKPPFRLAQDQSQEKLRVTLRDFADSCRSFSGAPLMLARLGGFLALVLREPSDELSQLAASCVSQFDCFRMPPDQDELARRRHNGLTTREIAHVDRWGYPYVFDTWKFHMTLTSSLPASTSDLVYAHLETRLTPLWKEPFVVDSLCLFQEPSPGGQFSFVERFPFRS